MEDWENIKITRYICITIAVVLCTLFLCIASCGKNSQNKNAEVSKMYLERGFSEQFDPLAGRMVWKRQ